MVARPMNETDPAFSVSPVRRDLPQDHPPDAREFFTGGAEYLLVVAERALSGMRRQAGASPRREIGGVLVGRHYRTVDQYLVTVEDHVAVPSRNTGAAHFEFDESSIQAIQRRLARRPDQYVVGWYHSHIGGTPFMSSMDEILHGDHFRQPWHVSCVVSAGSWGRAAGFWRMADGELVEISDYSIAVSQVGDSDDQHHAFLGACGFAEAEKPEFSVASLVSMLGAAEGGPLTEGIAEAAAAWQETEGLADAQFLIHVAQTVAANPEAMAEVESLSHRMRQLRVLGDIAEPALFSGALNDRISASGDECYAYAEGKAMLSRIDIDEGVVIPVRVASRPASVAHAPDGHAWVLTESARLLRMPTVDTVRWLDGDHDFPVMAAELPKLPTRANQLVVGESTVWLRAAKTWHRIAYTRDDAIRLGAEDSGQLPVADCLFVSGNGLYDDDAGPTIVANDDGRLKTWAAHGSGWTLRQDVPLPSPWNKQDLVQVSSHGLGWYLLFRDQGKGQLCLFDRDSLELVYQVVRPPKDDFILPLTAICGDGEGRLYVQAGGVLYRA